MSSSDYILISAAAAAAVLLAALAARRPVEKKEPQRETTRWRRFRILFGVLHGRLEDPACAVAEEPSGLKLLAAPREDSPSAPVRLAGNAGRDAVEVRRGRLFFSRRLRVLLGGKEYVHALVPKPGDRRMELRFVAPGAAYEVQGNMAGREFEVRRQGRLVANVSWQSLPGQEGPRQEYFVESLKTEDPLPILALVLAAEVALPAKT